MQANADILLHAMEHEASILNALGEELHAQTLADRARKLRILFALGAELVEVDEGPGGCKIDGGGIPTVERNTTSIQSYDASPASPGTDA